MSASIAVLLETLSVRPDVIVGHSAGAAIALQMALTQKWDMPIAGLNPALLPFPGLAAKLFPALAKVLFTNPFVSTIFSRMARRPADVDRFLRKSTGSAIEPAGVAYYHALFSRSGHCDGAIRMMASWDLESLERRLSEVSATVMLLHASKDAAIPHSAVARAAKLIPSSEFEQVTGLGHLAHEEEPDQIAAMVKVFAQQAAS
jgi:magnesium chelatase accessory protein